MKYWVLQIHPKIEIWSTPDLPKNVNLEYSRFTKKVDLEYSRFWKIWKPGVTSVDDWNFEYSRFTKKYGSGVLQNHQKGESGVLQIWKIWKSGVASVENWYHELLQIHPKIEIWSTPDSPKMCIWSTPDSPKNVDLEYSRFWIFLKSGLACLENWYYELLQIHQKMKSGVLQIHQKMWIWSTPDFENFRNLD